MLDCLCCTTQYTPQQSTVSQKQINICLSYQNEIMESTPTEHHKRFEYCTTRLQYRQGRELKAVKVINLIERLLKYY